jgi:hypothetical protein
MPNELKRTLISREISNWKFLLFSAHFEKLERGMAVHLILFRLLCPGIDWNLSAGFEIKNAGN